MLQSRYQKNYLIIGDQVSMIFMAHSVTIATVRPAKNTFKLQVLIIQKRHGETHFVYCQIFEHLRRLDSEPPCTIFF